MPDVAGVPSAEELAALPHDELAARLAEAYRVIAGLTARVELLERRSGWDSDDVEAAVVGQPVSEEAAGPVAAGAGQAATGQAAGRAGNHDEAGR